MPSHDSSFSHRFVPIVLIALTLAAGITLRCLFPTADPPKDITISGGIIGDPGQYQYGARNQILFGQPVLDVFAPHLFSPLIHPLNILVYSWFGISLTSHRLLPLIFSILILGFFWLMLQRLLDRTTALLASIFLAFSYPLIIYSHIDYREYPMTFFCLLAFWAFARGAESGKTRPFVVSGLFFILSFLSKGSGVYLLAAFIGVGLVWLVEKRIHWRQLAAFCLTLAAGFAGWWRIIYLSNQGVLKTLMSDNSSVRRIDSLASAWQNLWTSPMMLFLRYDPVLFMVAGIILLWLITARFSRSAALPPIVDLAFAWLASGALFHGIVSYRPTRFYLILILPAALISGYGLGLLSRRQSLQPLKPVATLPALPVWLLTLIALGFPVYFSMLPHWSALKISLHLAAALGTLLLFLPHCGLWTRRTLVGLLLAASLACNLEAYLRWSRQRQYEMPAIIEILAKAIPPSRIAGNWAAHLSIGTPHRTYLAWPGFINWQSDFLTRNRIEYLLLARHRNFDEVSFYRNFFQAEWPKMQLMAEFDLLNAKVQLLRLAPETAAAAAQIEMEALPRSAGQVRYQAEAGQQMVVRINQAAAVDFTLPAPQATSISGLTIRAAGRFSLQIKNGPAALARILINSSGSGLKEVSRFFDPPLNLGSQPVIVSVQALDKSAELVLDRIAFMTEKR